MAKRSNNWYITGWKAFALIPISVPIILLLRLLGIGKTINRSPADVAGFIRDFIEGTGGEWDWDDFISVPITSPELEPIRAQAAMIELPLNPAGVDELKELLAKAEALAGRQVTQSFT